MISSYDVNVYLNSVFDFLAGEEVEFTTSWGMLSLVQEMDRRGWHYIIWGPSVTKTWGIRIFLNDKDRTLVDAESNISLPWAIALGVQKALEESEGLGLA